MAGSLRLSENCLLTGIFCNIDDLWPCLTKAACVLEYKCGHWSRSTCRVYIPASMCLLLLKNSSNCSYWLCLKPAWRDVCVLNTAYFLINMLKSQTWVDPITNWTVSDTPSHNYIILIFECSSMGGRHIPTELMREWWPGHSLSVS